MLADAGGPGALLLGLPPLLAPLRTVICQTAGSKAHFLWPVPLGRWGGPGLQQWPPWASQLARARLGQATQLNPALGQILDNTGSQTGWAFSLIPQVNYALKVDPHARSSCTESSCPGQCKLFGRVSVLPLQATPPGKPQNWHCRNQKTINKTCPLPQTSCGIQRCACACAAHVTLTQGPFSPCSVQARRRAGRKQPCVGTKATVPLCAFCAIDLGAF